MKETILVVDDEELVRLTLSKELEGEGYQTKLASDGEEAISVLQKEAFDLVITDLKMPKIDGIEVLKFIQNNKEKLLNPNIRTIVLTAFASLKNCLESKKFGARDFISKPYDLLDLVTTVERVLEEKKLNICKV